MAESTPTQDDLYLRRRARRRLVGAVALALLAVVVLPMVFDSEPRPLGDQVEIHIPDQNTPFVPMPPGQDAQPALAPAMTDPVADAVASPQAQDAPAGVSTPPAKVVTQNGPAGKAKPESAIRPIVKAEAKPAEPAKAPPAAKPTPRADDKPEAKPTPKAETKAAAKVDTKPATKPESAAYFLQLGVFSSPANAEAQVAKAKVAGFKASVQREGARFKVRVGPLAERVKALDYQGKLKAKGIDNVLIEP